MNEREVHKRLVMFELKATPLRRYLMAAALMALAIYFGSEMMSFYMDGQVSIGIVTFFDCIFLFVLVYTPYVFRHKPFQVQELKGNLYVSPFFIFLKQTPLSEKVLIKSRFFLHYLFYIPGTVLILSGIYLFSDGLRQAVPIGQFPFYLISFLALGMIMSGMFPAAEPGALYRNKLVIWFYVVLIYGGAIAFLTLFSRLTDGKGFIHFIVHLSVAYPLVTATGAVILAVLCHQLWKLELRRLGRKVDYHV